MTVINGIALYGDGIHDDTQALQQLIDLSEGGKLSLPKPEKCYLISETLVMPSDTALELPDDAVVRLADGSNCMMLRNRMKKDPARRLGEVSSFATYIDVFSPSDPQKNISVRGGIWDCNNMNQRQNPLIVGVTQGDEFTGHGMLFYNVSGLTLSNVTIKDPTNFGIGLDSVTDFEVSGITFDYNLGNPMTICMDGVHLYGNCRRGTVRNLHGTVYDDLVALNSDEGSGGPIEDVEVDGLYAENCHSAIRILGCFFPVRNVRISNVHGTYYQYCIGITKFYDGKTVAAAENITVENVFASKAERTVYPHPDSYVYPFFYIEAETKVRNLTVRNLLREEYVNPVETFFIGNSAKVSGLTLENVKTVNHTGKQMPLFVIYGSVSDAKFGNVETVSPI